MRAIEGGPVICTIVAKNYTSFARTLCKSFLQVHPHGSCHVLVVDSTEGYIDSDKECFTLARLSDLGIADLTTFTFRYNITELSTAAKPFFLEYLMNLKDVNRVLYLDPDILVTAPLDTIFESLDVHSMVLTPHLDADYPDDGLLPNDSHIMKSGIFNLGFIGVRKCSETNRFLKWWQVKLKDRCVIDHKAGYFVDQKFIDYAQPLFDGFGIIDDAGCNVAYWNIHSRRISQAEGGWLCNGKPLRFFHFSDYKPETPNVMSRHQNRYNLSDIPSLRALFDSYKSALAANGYHQTREWPYSYGQFSNGRRITDAERHMFRANPALQRIEDPFNWSAYSLGARLKFRFHKRAYWFAGEVLAWLRKLI